ncbi:DUF2528 family protein [Dickeya oryzae]|uniref:DUF2528 family protein n=1 Tax=Dickeya oryzae TaxID=1240404 RepID=UPI0031F4E441
MDIRKYCVEWDGQLTLMVEIDHDIVTAELLMQINFFWSNARDRLEDAGGNVLVAVLKMLGQRCWQMVIAHGYNTQGLIREFGNGVEGWPKMDGSNGFRILDCEEIEFDESDITVDEIHH